MNTTARSDASSLEEVQAEDSTRDPGIARLMHRLGLGEFIADGIDSFMGQHRNWAGRTTSGAEVLIKDLASARETPSPGLKRSISYERTAAARKPPGALRSPRCLGWDTERSLIAFEYLRGRKTASALMLGGRFGPPQWHAVGLAVGDLHAFTPRPGPQCMLDTSPPAWPPLDWLEALPWPQAQESSMAQLAAWRLIQDDAALVTALRRLRWQEGHTSAVPSHCDLRLDQILQYHGTLHICDWEEFRLADPARDLGSLLGELLFHAVLSALSDLGADSGSTPSHERILVRGTTSIRRHRPHIAAFWHGYARTSSAPPDRALATRAAAFAGWHMFDRLLAGSDEQARLSPVARAAAGIGRSLVLTPERAVSLLGPRSGQGGA
ncbi:class V lanthionine synthetase subunit LxmK [Kitasatospora sp. NPDC059827]|uniref:class V lanthionine synthetase subunit LxmK n=1 Tax=Kitasatospora sp. NPDC059827 TaxID=3346964 RepID=UPI00366134B0